MAVSSRKLRGEGHERHGEILEAARRVFSDEGPEKTTMRRLAQAAEISPATLYIYFRDKEAILAAIRDETFTAMAKSIEGATEGVSEPVERVRRQLEAYVAFAMDNADVYWISYHSRLIRAPRRGIARSPREERGRGAFTHFLTDVEALFRQLGNADEESAYMAAEAAWSAIHGLIMLSIDVPHFPQSGFDETARKLVDIVVAGLCAPN